MPTDGMDAAAVPVPDAGDDTLRLAIATTIGNHTVPIKATLPNGEQTWPASIHILIGESEVGELADALLPRIREHAAAAVQAERERVLGRAATVLERKLQEFPAGGRHTRAGWAVNYLRSSIMTHDLAALDGTEANHDH